MGGVFPSVLEMLGLVGVSEFVHKLNGDQFDESTKNTE